MTNEHEHCVAQAYEDAPPKVLDRLRYHLFVCTDGKDFCGCEASGSAQLVTALRQELARRRLLAQVKLNIMQCRQPAATGPVLVVHPDGIWYDGLQAADVPEFVDQQIVHGEPLARRLMQSPPMPVTAVPAHIADPADGRVSEQRTPEERAGSA